MKSSSKKRLAHKRRVWDPLRLAQSPVKSMFFVSVSFVGLTCCLTVWKVPPDGYHSRSNCATLLSCIPFQHWCKSLRQEFFYIWAVTRLPNLSCHAGITVAGTVGLSTISVSYPLFTSISWYCELVLLSFSSFFDRITKRYTFWQWIRQNTTTAFFHKFDTFLSKYIAF